jgi:hypothetical protein
MADMGKRLSRKSISNAGGHFDELVKNHPNRWLCKEPKFKAREAQRRNWTIYEAINFDWVMLYPNSTGFSI